MFGMYLLNKVWTNVVPPKERRSFTPKNGEDIAAMPRKRLPVTYYLFLLSLLSIFVTCCNRVSQEDRQLTTFPTQRETPSVAPTPTIEREREPTPSAVTLSATPAGRPTQTATASVPAATPTQSVSMVTSQAIPIDSWPMVGVLFADNMQLLYWNNVVDETIVLFEEVDKYTQATLADNGEYVVVTSGNFTHEASVTIVKLSEPLASEQVTNSDFYEESASMPTTFYVKQLAWIPESRRLLLNVRTDIEGGALIADDIILLDVETLSWTRLTADGKSGEFSVAPDGSAVVIGNQTDLYWLGGDGYRELKHILSFEGVYTYSSQGFFPKPLWSADTTRFLVYQTPSDWLLPELSDVPTKIWEFDVVADTLTLVTETVAYPVFHDFFLSPDGKRVALARPRPNRNLLKPVKIVVVDLETEDERELLNGDYELLGWNFDSTKLLLSQEDDIVVIDVASGDLTSIENEVLVDWFDGDYYLSIDVNAAELQLGTFSTSEKVSISSADTFFDSLILPDELER